MKHHIFFLNNRICLFGNAISHRSHSHYLIQIVVRYHLLTKDLKVELVNSNHSHAMHFYNGKYFSILLDPLSMTGKAIQQLFENKGADELCIKLKDLALFDKLDDTTSLDEVRDLSDSLIAMLVAEKKPKTDLDARIHRVLKYINGNEDLHIEAKELYDIAGLSESHFHLLFKDNVGIPLRKYILWLKLYRAISSILVGEDFTTAAQNGDFADSAHLAKTFKSNTGLSLSTLFKNKQFVQVYTENLS